MISLSDIRKSFDRLEVLRGVSLDVEAGEVMSIVGPSGAGKTTLLHIMGTLDRPDSGKVSYDGRRTNWQGSAIRRSVLCSSSISSCRSFP